MAAVPVPYLNHGVLSPIVHCTLFAALEQELKNPLPLFSQVNKFSAKEIN